MARHRFFHLLSLARHRVAKVTDRVCQEELGIGGAQLAALVIIHARPGLRQRELAEALGYNESAVTAALKRMIEADLVVRAPSRADRRAREIRLTARGTAIVDEAQPLIAGFNERLQEGFAAAELDAAAAFLERAIERFDPEE